VAGGSKYGQIDAFARRYFIALQYPESSAMNSIEDRVRIEDKKLLSDNHYFLHVVTFKWKRADGAWQEGKREVYDRGDGCAILLFNRAKRSVVLTRQLRIPIYMRGYHQMLIEVAAGLLDKADPVSRIMAETEEETGYTPFNVTQAFALFMSPGSVTEKLTLFTGEYDPARRKGKGGGVEDEGEDIEVLELAFDDAVAMMADGRICDAKTIILLQHAQLHIFKD
jgi:nudix-type nucleoside diphosphatase (YffH/AdpP family)